MARSKNDDGKAKDSAGHQISVEDFIRTRDSVVTGLSTLQSAVAELSHAYIAHTNTVLGKGLGASLNQLNFSGALGGDNGFFNARAPTPAPTLEVQPEGKKRKRAPHDKNAPKRALTPFFLYLQTARPLIAQEMGDTHTAKEVQDEGGRRWREMSSEEKEIWTEKYGINFARYKEHMKAYKAGQPIPQISDAEAKMLFEENNKAGKMPRIDQLEVGHVAAEGDDEAHEEGDEEEDGGEGQEEEEEVEEDIGGEALEEKEDEEEGERDESSDDTSSEEESPQPPKAPSPVPPAKKQKMAKENPKKKHVSARKVPVEDSKPTVSPTPKLTSRSPEKKKKGNKKNDHKGANDITKVNADVIAEPTGAPSPLPILDSQHNAKKKGRKRKSDAEL